MKNYLKHTCLAMVALIGLSQVVRADTTFGENPVQDYWNPVSPNGTHVYAQSFVAQASGDVSVLGTWLNTLDYDASTTLKFQILGSLSGNPVLGPTISTVYASTAAIGSMSGPTSYYSGAATSYTSLVAGQTYWFAINAIGGGGNGRYQASSANDDLQDGGSFWYSNSSGSYFDGQNNQPGMAFKVTVSDSSSVPDAGSTVLLLLSGFVGLVAVRRKLAVR
ncbi:VPDSG-CTERM sorting domain-containing protein [Oleiharenicola lentus]|jgi:hypothetical protein|uniref:VPDSG-CTERM sorting domain-containing protein n=1 Tax=Oleiharenicola lentus TaxID=2508720 RepID=A0A4Q1C8S4_9BACT|nr:VPDSG-CTERM sorting domain-containing protein [Oleiharenicola lentus]RXK55222.1 VPDSG-CTERM sorting domain-containing protein [Oleiharenicola lentus]